MKPIYIARTYNFQLAEDQSSFTAEDVLDKLARQKGRLLKGGEPDLNGVAKILLSDWVRGRIPFFVSPPERSEELNKEEEKKRKKGKGKEKAKEEAVLGVKQNLGSIMQNNTFVGDDVRPLDDAEEGEVEVELDQEDDGGDDSGSEEEELAWDDVFKPAGVQANPEEAVSEEEAEEEGEKAAEGLSSQTPLCYVVDAFSKIIRRRRRRAQKGVSYED